MTDEHFARRYLLNDTNTTTTPPPATEAVFFEYTIVSLSRRASRFSPTLPSSCFASSSCYTWPPHRSTSSRSIGS